MDTSQIITILQAVIGILVCVMFVLIAVYFLISRKKENDDSKLENEFIVEDKKKTETVSVGDFGKFQGVLTRESVFDFMEFDEIVDNMIIRKNRSQYVMVLSCSGVNYDLMSQAEKYAVEEGFVQFLNTLRFPIQLYVQSRTLNLKDIIASYKERVENITNDISKLDSKIAQAKQTGNKAMLEKLEFEKRRKNSVLEYGQNITDYVERLSSNKNILQQKTYIVLSYYTVEIGGNVENYSKEELNSICFSELYTRSQNVISSLGNSQVTARILNSEELAELLFIAYNRDDEELVQINKMLDVQYDSLYSTGKDVLEKRQEKLDQEINIAAIDLTTDSILKADKKKQEEDKLNEQNKKKAIKEKALNILSEYEEQLDPRVFELASQEISKTAPEENKSSESATSKTSTGKTARTFSARRVIKRKTETED